jgi:flagellar motor protein MotB
MIPSTAHNQQLSAARARAVVDALVTTGVEPGRLRSEGFGSSRPPVENDSDEHRAVNRRVELRIESRAAAP